MNLNDHEIRVVQEAVELLVKVVALKKFIGGTIYHDLETIDKTHLKQQHATMSRYHEILESRIARFKGV